MKKFFSLVLALVMALSLTTIAWGADPVTHEVADKAALTAALNTAADGDIIKLTANIDMGTDYAKVAKKLTLDLGQFIITSANTDMGTVYVGTAGDLTINATTGGVTNTVKNAIGNYGVLVVNGGTFTGDYALYNYYYDATTFGTATINGGTFQANSGDLAIANCGKLTVAGGDIETLDSSAELKVTGGSIEELAVTEPDYAPPVTETTISDGTVESLTVEAAVEDSIAISGGTFSGDVSDYVVDGKQLLANGTVVTTPTVSATDPVLYVWDNAAEDWLSYYIATGEYLDDMTQDSSDNCLPCYLIDGQYFLEVPAASASYKLVYGAKTVYLTAVPAKVVKYADTASVLTVVAEDDAECGDFYVADNVYDDEDVYYISYNKKGDTVDGIYVAKKNGSVQILVGSKIVNVEDAFATVKFLNHDWEGYEVVNKAYVSVKCSECDKVAKLYANATAAGKKAVPVLGGWITFADAMDFGANAPAVTDKVESAETFDAGIALYVGMSVMAAAGSAVVIGKKRED